MSEDYWEKKYAEKVKQEEYESQMGGCVVMTVCIIGIITLIVLGFINASK